MKIKHKVPNTSCLSFWLIDYMPPQPSDRGRRSIWTSPIIDKYYILMQVLHYAQELFEGMKAYRGVDDDIRLFRPMHNMTRMISSAKRACLPTFEAEELLECMRR